MKKILTAAEYTSLGVSALGTIAAATTGHIAYATSPLICSLFLNIVNKSKLDRNTSQNITHQITSVKNNFAENSHSLSEKIRNIEHTFNAKDNSKDIKQDYQQDFVKLTQQIETLKSDLTQLKNNNYSNEIDEFNYLIQNNLPKYQLVFDRRESRDIFLEALQQAQERIILVCPWITYYGADNEVLEYCRAFLNKGGYINIGWGHLKDIDEKKHISMSRDEFLRIVKINQKDWVYNQLEKFIELEKQYPNCNLKLLGTHEKFLVCDRSFAMIGSHNFLTSNCHSSERELGLRTNDKNIIEDLINRFQNAESLDDKQSKYYVKNKHKLKLKKK